MCLFEGPPFEFQHAALLVVEPLPGPSFASMIAPGLVFPPSSGARILLSHDHLVAFYRNPSLFVRVFFFSIFFWFCPSPKFSATGFSEVAVLTPRPPTALRPFGCGPSATGTTLRRPPLGSPPSLFEAGF